MVFSPFLLIKSQAKFLFIFLCLFMIIGAFKDPKEAQWDALVDFYNATHGDHWTYKTNWLATTVSWCYWHGISCDKYQNIHALSLNNNNLVGSIPESIVNIWSLEYIDLSSNSITEPIPYSLIRSTHLGTLNLSGNKIKGPLPDYLFLSRTIVWLYLGNNQFSGEIPKSFGELSYAQAIILSNNQLVGTIPESISKLTLCSTIDLSYNQLSGTLPSSLARDDVIFRFNLNNNKLSGSLTELLTGRFADNVSYLYLENNQFTSLKESVPSPRYMTLYHCDFRTNDFVCPIPAWSITKCQATCKNQ